jgi:hypothetical protein
MALTECQLSQSFDCEHICKSPQLHPVGASCCGDTTYNMIPVLTIQILLKRTNRKLLKGKDYLNIGDNYVR